ncbi:MAG: hypothetical protein JWL97_727 [Gemmatimonadales bacterium]|nr:hypothetical protein [Gemmatimonadales bacterium]
MESVPSTKILDRELSAAITKDVRDVGRPALRELVDEGIRVFERCSATATGHDENIGLLFPHLHLIETLDAAELALDGSSTVGANIILRPSFEALLTVEWVARHSDLRYGAAYVVADIYHRIGQYERYSLGHPKQQQLLSAIESDAIGKNLKVPTEEDAVAKIAGLQQLLSAPHLAAAAAEYQRTRNKNKKKIRPPFHALWDGPGNVEQLAKQLDRSAFYEILYRGWSQSTHALDVVRQLGHKDGSPAVRRFRDGDGLKTAYSLALTFGLIGIRAVLTFYRKDELTAHAKWYKEKISEPFRRLSEGN